MTSADRPTGEELLGLAVAAAAEAGQMLAASAGHVAVADTKSSPTDVVTEMDRRAEEMIRSRILESRPGDVILGEEGGQAGGAAGGDVRWVVDPLDGTVNYLYGLPDWAVSIAAEVAGEIVAGAVYLPIRGELFSAARGEGAWLGQFAPGTPVSEITARSGGGPVRLHCGPGVPLEQALVGTGFGYQAARRKVQGEVVAALLPLVRDVRRAGAASVDICSVAAGRLDAFYERGLNYWDYAAGALIAAEAGAVVGDSRGGPPTSSMTVVAGPGLFGPLAAFLDGLDAERDG